MEQKYEYKFLRIGEGWLGVKKEGMNGYQDVVHQHADEGWRLVQVFAPSFGAYGTSKYVEMIFERELEKSP